MLVLAPAKKKNKFWKSSLHLCKDFETRFEKNEKTDFETRFLTQIIFFIFFVSFLSFITFLWDTYNFQINFKINFHNCPITFLSFS